MAALIIVLVALAVVVVAVAALFLIVYVAGRSGQRAQQRDGLSGGPAAGPVGS